MKRKHKAVLIAGATLLGLILALGIFLLVWFLGERYPEFEEMTKEEIEIPGLESGMSPQGLTSLPRNREGFDFAVSGYLSKQPSRVYLVGSDNERVKYFTLADEEGKDISTHFGGITCTENYLIVASGTKLVRVSLREAIEAEDGARITIADSVKLEGLRSIAYCTTWDDLIFAGEFYRKGSHETEESHHLEVSGGVNYGIIYAYRANEEKVGGIENDDYIYAISVPAKVQGIAIWDRGIALSTSYGLADSKILIYRNVLHYSPKREWNGKPLYVLDESNLSQVITSPCMSEELFEKDGRIYVLFESASKKYKTFVRRQMKHVVSFASPYAD